MSYIESMQFSVHFETLGCKLNQIETESAARAFSLAGFLIDLDSVTASTIPNKNTIVCVINTCTVTGKAEQKARRLIRLLQKLFPTAVMIVTGCYAEVEPEEIKKLGKYVLILPGTKKDTLSIIPSVIKQHIDSLNLENCISENIFDKIQPSLFEALNTFLTLPIYTFQNKNFTRFSLSTDTFVKHSRSSIKIQDGCDNRCAYCRICIARGPSISLDAKSVIERVKLLENQKQTEVVLTGVNISQYNSLYDGRSINISDLLELLLSQTNSISFRFSSLYPDKIDDKFYSLIKNDRVRPHFHLSVQSGSTNILHSMGRNYNSDTIFSAVTKLKAAKGNPFIACDIIAGFPGESDQDFYQTIQLCEKSNFTWIHAFPFSARPGTKAFSMTSKVKDSVSKERVKILTLLARTNKISYISSFIGKPLSAIIQTGESQTVKAVTENFIHLRILLPKEIDPKTLARKEVKIKITQILTDSINQDQEDEAEAVLWT